MKIEVPYFFLHSIIFQMKWAKEGWNDGFVQKTAFLRAALTATGRTPVHLSLQGKNSTPPSNIHLPLVLYRYRSRIKNLPTRARHQVWWQPQCTYLQVKKKIKGFLYRFQGRVISEAPGQSP